MIRVINPAGRIPEREQTEYIFLVNLFPSLVIPLPGGRHVDVPHQLLRRYGFNSEGLPIQRKDGHIVVHVVHGHKSSDSYGYLSGSQTATEIRRALAGTMDLDREHVLILYGLCRKEADGRYLFHAPYYGGGTHRAGLCHAADCELLDPRLLMETNQEYCWNDG